MQIARGGGIRREIKIVPSQINKKDKNNKKIKKIKIKIIKD
jgi:hypothetical protein